MTVTDSDVGTEGAEYRYHRLRAASERFQSDLAALDPPQLAEIERQARWTFALETLVLQTPEAASTCIADARLDAAVAELRARFPDEVAFLADLARNGLDERALRLVLRRELIFDAVMQGVGAAAAEVTEHDERHFYELNREGFCRPERRLVRHILVTINEDYPENRRDAALARMERIAAQAAGRSAERFGELAAEQSECPTAMQAGSLGSVTRGQLFPELDLVLFELGEGEISGILESQLGFHLLLCEHIEPPATLSFDLARPRIRTALETRRRRERQKDWIEQLRSAAPATGDVQTT